MDEINIRRKSRRFLAHVLSNLGKSEGHFFSLLLRELSQILSHLDVFFLDSVLKSLLQLLGKDLDHASDLLIPDLLQVSFELLQVL